MITLLNDYTPLLLRILLVVLFPFSALNKLVDWQAAMQQAGEIPFAKAMVGVAVLVEFVTPVCIVTGWHDRLAAFVLAGFCAVTAVLYHQFWRFADFYRFREGEGMRHFWDFLKNFGLVGGLGLVVLAPQTRPATDFLLHPLASTQVIGAHTGVPMP